MATNLATDRGFHVCAQLEEDGVTKEDGSKVNEAEEAQIVDEFKKKLAAEIIEEKKKIILQMATERADHLMLTMRLDQINQEMNRITGQQNILKGIRGDMVRKAIIETLVETLEFDFITDFEPNTSMADDLNEYVRKSYLDSDTEVKAAQADSGMSLREWTRCIALFELTWARHHDMNMVAGSVADPEELFGYDSYRTVLLYC